MYRAQVVRVPLERTCDEWEAWRVGCDWGAATHSNDIATPEYGIVDIVSATERSTATEVLVDLVYKGPEGQESTLSLILQNRVGFLQAIGRPRR
jgi:hypothetical protein